MSVRMFDDYYDDKRPLLFISTIIIMIVVVCKGPCLDEHMRSVPHAHRVYFLLFFVRNTGEIQRDSSIDQV